MSQGGEQVMVIRLWDVEWDNGAKRTVSAIDLNEAIKIARKNFPFKEEIIGVSLVAEEDEPEEEEA
jgi:hypothetical protein